MKNSLEIECEGVLWSYLNVSIAAADRRRPKNILDDMITICIEHQSHDILLCELVQQVCKLHGWCCFDGLLYNTTTIFIEAELEKMGLDVIVQFLALIEIADGEKLLHHKIGETMHHQCMQIGMELFENFVFTIFRRFVQFSLDEFWSISILGKFTNIFISIVQLIIGAMVQKIEQTRRMVVVMLVVLVKALLMMMMMLLIVWPVAHVPCILWSLWHCEFLLHKKFNIYRREKDEFARTEREKLTR